MIWLNWYSNETKLKFKRILTTEKIAGWNEFQLSFEWVSFYPLWNAIVSIYSKNLDSHGNFRLPIDFEVEIRMRQTIYTI